MSGHNFPSSHGNTEHEPRGMHVDRSSCPEASCTSTPCTKKIKCVRAQSGRESTDSLANRSRLYALLAQEPEKLFRIYFPKQFVLLVGQMQAPEVKYKGITHPYYNTESGFRIPDYQFPIPVESGFQIPDRRFRVVVGLLHNIIEWFDFKDSFLKYI